MIIDKFAAKVGDPWIRQTNLTECYFTKKTMWQDKFIQRKNRHRKEKRQEKRRKNILIYTSFIPVFITILTFFWLLWFIIFSDSLHHADVINRDKEPLCTRYSVITNSSGFFSDLIIHFLELDKWFSRINLHFLNDSFPRKKLFLRVTHLVFTTD